MVQYRFHIVVRVDVRPYEACPKPTNKSIISSRVLRKICENGLPPKLNRIDHLASDPYLARFDRFIVR